jgi:hypothetical protein
MDKKMGTLIGLLAVGGLTTLYSPLSFYLGGELKEPAPDLAGFLNIYGFLFAGTAVVIVSIIAIDQQSQIKEIRNKLDRQN